MAWNVFLKRQYPSSKVTNQAFLTQKFYPFVKSIFAFVVSNLVKVSKTNYQG